MAFSIGQQKKNKKKEGRKEGSNKIAYEAGQSAVHTQTEGMNASGILIQIHKQHRHTNGSTSFLLIRLLNVNLNLYYSVLSTTIQNLNETHTRIEFFYQKLTVCELV